MNAEIGKPKTAVNVKCQLAENPLWHEETNSIFWTDITAGRIFRLGLTTGECETVYRGEPVGGFTFQENGDLLLFRLDNLTLLTVGREKRLIREFSDAGMTRFNDVIAAPDGGVFAGTIGNTKESGGLYRVDVEGSIRKLFSGTGCSNGMGFSPNRKVFYWTNSTTREIFQFDYDEKSGSIGNRRIFYRATADEGVPDGLTVDLEGCIWSARWGGGSLVRHSENGDVLERINFPEKNVTSICFGGENLSRLFATAARKDDKSPSVTALFELNVSVCGKREFRSRIG